MRCQKGCPEIVVMFYYKIFNEGNDILIAVCDKEILGKKIKRSEGEFEVKKDFYGEKECNEEEIKEILKKATIINATGNKIVKLMIEEGFVDKDKTLKLGDVSHAQVVFI